MFRELSLQLTLGANIPQPSVHVISDEGGSVKWDTERGGGRRTYSTRLKYGTVSPESMNQSGIK